MPITDNVLPTALFYCCDTNLRTDIMRDLQGDVASMIETDLLKAIKRLAVKEESTLVQRIKLQRMTQSPGSNIRTFLASLRGQASLCQYIATCKELGCNHIFDYSDEIIKDNLVRDAISNFPTPTDITGSKAWFDFWCSIETTHNILLTNELDNVFHKSKEIIIQEMKEGVRLFDPARMTCLATDWSVDDVGFY
ncbi:unnamed protein product [Mytilus edulis]|uniref:Uncharacterized protein n=1 Tax=Mytilus edulis TaxID=6550 RepID=A0A8S3SP14_MYTED|nr:unnamed protein product [Mytilus edulis]